MKTKQTGKILSLMLVMCMVFTMMPVAAFAEAGDVDFGAPLGVSEIITAFAELDVAVPAQTVEIGMAKEKLTLPDALTVTVVTGSAVMATDSTETVIPKNYLEVEDALRSTTSKTIKINDNFTLNNAVIVGANHTLLIPSDKTIFLAGYCELKIPFGIELTVEGGGTLVCHYTAKKAISVDGALTLNSIVFKVENDGNEVYPSGKLTATGCNTKITNASGLCILSLGKLKITGGTLDISNTAASFSQGILLISDEPISISDCTVNLNNAGGSAIDGDMYIKNSEVSIEVRGDYNSKGIGYGKTLIFDNSNVTIANQYNATGIHSYGADEETSEFKLINGSKMQVKPQGGTGISISPTNSTSSTSLIIDDSILEIYPGGILGISLRNGAKLNGNNNGKIIFNEDSKLEGIPNKIKDRGVLVTADSWITVGASSADAANNTISEGEYIWNGSMFEKVGSDVPLMEVTSVIVNLTAPVKGTNSAMATTTGTGYNMTSTKWKTTRDGTALTTGQPFAADTAYTATIVLTSAANYKFGTVSFSNITGTNGTVQNAATGDGDTSGNTLTVIVNYPATAGNAPTTYAVNVTNGTANPTTVVADATVTITANTAPSGQRFKEWSITPTVEFTDGTTKNSLIAKFIMPAGAVTATATYEAIRSGVQTITIGTTVNHPVYGNGDINDNGNDNSLTVPLTDPNGNTVIVSGTVDGGHAVSGSYVYSSDSAVTASGNIVVINGGTAGGAFGSQTQSYSHSATTSSNTVTVNGGTIGGYGLKGGSAITMGNATATGSTVTISDSAVGGNVYGGYASSDTGSSTATGNTVTISGGVLNGNIYGGYVFGNNIASATGNTVTISGALTLHGSLYGGFLDIFSSASTVDLFTDNILNLHSAISVAEAVNFEYLNFYLPASISNSGTMLNVTTATDLTDVNVNVAFDTTAPTFSVGDGIILINNVSGTFTNKSVTVSGYTFALSVESSKLIATVTGIPIGTVSVKGVSLSKSNLSLYSNAAPKTAILTETVSPTDATDRSVIWNSGNTSVATVDQSGNITAVGNGSAVITATTTDGGYTAFCTVTVTTYSNSGSGGGSSSGGSSDGDSSSSGGTTTPITITITPEKKPDQPVTASAPVTATTGKDGTASVIIPDNTMTDAIEKAQTDAKAQGKTTNGTSVALNVTMPQGATALTATLTPNSLHSLVNAGVTSLRINGAPVSIVLNLVALKEIQKQSGGNISISIAPATELSNEAKALIGNRPVYNVTISTTKDGKTTNVTSLGNGTATLSIPYTLGKNEAVGYLFGVYVDGKGKVTRIAGSAYDANTSCVIFTTTHFALYGIGYTAPSAKFTDIGTHWGKGAIDYTVGRGLLSGTSETTFAPNTDMTRGMLVTALGRLAGMDVKAYTTNSFNDVKADSTFRPYIEWAYKKGIVQGIGNQQFAPDRSITHEEIAVIFANYAKATGYKLPVTREATAYADASSIGSVYKTAVTAMQQAGIMIGGSGNKFNPQKSTTRAEASIMLHRYIKLTIDPKKSQGWALNDAGQYLYYKDGKALTGMQTIDDVKYFFNTDGSLKTGWVKDDDNWRYYSGNKATVGWLDISDKRYYFSKDGLMSSGK